MSPIVLLTTLCIAQILAMTSFANFAALLPDFVVLWDLSNTCLLYTSDSADE